MDGKVYETYRDMVKQVAAEYGKRFRMVDKSDIEQELWVWFLTHPNKVEEWMALENTKDSDKLIAKSLRNRALDFCTKEKLQQMGADISDNFYYTKQFVKSMLPAVLSNDWTKLNNILSGFGRSSKSLAESNDWIAYSADIMSAYDSLSKEDQQLVYYYYGEQVTGMELKELLNSNKTDKAIMMQANRVLNKMIHYIGGFPAYKDEDFSYGEDKDDMQQV